MRKSLFTFTLLAMASAIGCAPAANQTTLTPTEDEIAMYEALVAESEAEAAADDEAELAAESGESTESP